VLARTSLPAEGQSMSGSQLEWYIRALVFGVRSVDILKGS